MATRVELVPFENHQITTVRRDNDVFVVMKPIVAALGLDWNGQYQRIHRHPALKEGVCMTHIPSAGGEQAAVTLQLEQFQGWLVTLHPERVREPERRAMVLRYQRKAFRVLFDHFHGAAQLPAAMPIQSRIAIQNQVLRLTAKLQHTRNRTELTRSSARIRADRAGAGREEVVATARRREAEAADWLTANSDRIQRLLLAVVSHVPDVPTGITADVGADIARLANQLKTLSNAAAAAVAKPKDAERRLKELDDELVSAKTTMDDLDREISELGRQAPDLAAALSTVIPHIHGDDCPVCGRDYGEVSAMRAVSFIRRGSRDRSGSLQ